MEKKYIELRIYPDHVEKHEVDEERARGWIDNPGYHCCGDDKFYFIIETENKIEKAFNKWKKEEQKKYREKIAEYKQRLNTLKNYKI